VRVCTRGCGTRLVKPNGETDYKRRFCSSKCKLADLREKMQTKRAKVICPSCGRKASLGADVPRNKACGATQQAEVREVAQESK
jgi:endogenous inhibitor of DNA gyrase (YacG/DUF329 family)